MNLSFKARQKWFIAGNFSPARVELPSGPHIRRWVALDVAEGLKAARTLLQPFWGYEWLSSIFVERKLQQRQPQLPAAFAIQLSKSLL